MKHVQLTSKLDLSTIPAFLGEASGSPAPVRLAFTFDEKTQRITGKDAADVQRLVDDALALGFVGSEIPCFSYTIEAPLTLAMLGAILHMQWDISGQLPLPEIPEDALYIPENAVS